MNEGDQGVDTGLVRFPSEVVYRADPFARFLIETLKLGKVKAALAALGWSLTYLVAMPAMLGSLWGREGFLGSLRDWHAQVLLLLVFPATCAFYVWQPGAIARVYRVISGDGGASQERSRDARGLYGRVIWPGVSLVLGLAVILFDAPKMIAQYGSWWMTVNWLTVAVREASLAAAFYMMSMMTWRQLIATVEWNRLLAKPSRPAALQTVIAYELSCVFLLSLLGLRLSIEGVELPVRAGAITPDYYVKIAAYVVIALACFFAPVGNIPRRGMHVSLSQAVNLLKLAGIMALPLLAFVLFKVVL